MNNRMPEYDLSFMKKHCIWSVSFTLHSVTLQSQGKNPTPNVSTRNEAMVTLECDVIIDGEKKDRSELLQLLDKKYEDCWVDLDLNLHLKLSNGLHVVAIRNTNGFESFNIQWMLAPTKHVVII